MWMWVSVNVNVSKSYWHNALSELNAVWTAHFSSIWFDSIQFMISIQLGLVFIFTPSKMCNSLLVSRLFHWHFSLTHSLSMIRLSHEKLLIFRCSLLLLLLELRARALVRCLYHGSVPSRGLQNSLSNYLNTQRFRDFNIICVHHSVVILLLLYISTWNISWNFVPFTFHFIHSLIDFQWNKIDWIDSVFMLFKSQCQW